MKNAARLRDLDLDQEQRELLHPMKKTGRYELPPDSAE